MTYPLSMTSFGRGGYKNEDYKWLVEIRSVNHKYLDIRLKISRQFNVLEETIKKEIGYFFSRGHIEVNISLQGREAITPAINLNLPLARQYQEALQTLEEDLHIRDSQDRLSLLASFPGVIEAGEEEADSESVWPSLRRALQEALANCQEMREREGQNLKKDISRRLDLLEQNRTAIQDRGPELKQEKAENLKEKITNLLEDREISPDRLAQEIAIMADKADITEELVRLESHFQQFCAYLESAEPVGRKLDFLLQEFLREINTMASKISNSETAHRIVEMKNEVEKIREQVQNLE